MAKTLNTYSTCVDPAEGPEVVKSGFSWPGFIFGFIWAFLKRLWIVGAVLLPLDVALRILARYESVAEQVLLGSVLGTLSFVIRLIVGVNGNAWRRRDLKKRGYEHVVWVG